MKFTSSSALAVTALLFVHGAYAQTGCLFSRAAGSVTADGSLLDSVSITGELEAEAAVKCTVKCDSGEAKVSLSYDEQPTSANSDVSASGLCTGGGLNVTLAGRASFMPSAIGFLVEPVNMSATLPNVTIDCGCELPSINVCSSDLPFGSASAGLIASPSLLSVQASADGDVDIPCKITCESGGGNMRAYTATSFIPSTASFQAEQSGNCEGNGFNVTLEGEAEGSSFGFLMDVEEPVSGLRIACSCKERSGGGGSPACFSKDSTVQVMGQGTMPMKDLKVGDKVLVGNNKYGQVYSFGHLNKDTVAEFFQIYTEGMKKPLEVTGAHLVFRNGESVRADSVQVGDKLSSGTVNKISTTSKQGLYMPLTTDGTIVVDGVLASSYVSIESEAHGATEIAKVYIGNEQNLLHWWLAPYRMMCMGISGNFCNGSKSYNEKGILSWLSYGESLAKFASGQGSMMQHLMALPLMLVFGFFIATETVFGPSFGASALLLAGAGLVYRRRLQNNRVSEGLYAVKKHN